MRYHNLRFVAGLLADQSIQQSLTEAIAENGEEIISLKTEWREGQAAIICITGYPLNYSGKDSGKDSGKGGFAK